MLIIRYRMDYKMGVTQRNQTNERNREWDKKKYEQQQQQWHNARTMKNDAIDRHKSQRMICTLLCIELSTTERIGDRQSNQIEREKRVTYHMNREISAHSLFSWFNMLSIVAAVDMKYVRICIKFHVCTTKHKAFSRIQCLAHCVRSSLVSIHIYCHCLRWRWCNSSSTGNISSRACHLNGCCAYAQHLVYEYLQMQWAKYILNAFGCSGILSCVFFIFYFLPV